ncbi:MAG: hypothetical protein HUU15_04000, partial [Candidatus Brocadiae bacterium]|nr:hypothetical protein [Candidatus Brocadiia bacterium]
MNRKIVRLAGLGSLALAGVGLAQSAWPLEPWVAPEGKAYPSPVAATVDGSLWVRTARPAAEVLGSPSRRTTVGTDRLNSSIGDGTDAGNWWDGPRVKFTLKSGTFVDQIRKSLADAYGVDVDGDFDVHNGAGPIADYDDENITDTFEEAAEEASDDFDTEFIIDRNANFTAFGDQLKDYEAMRGKAVDLLKAQVDQMFKAGYDAQKAQHDQATRVKQQMITLGEMIDGMARSGAGTQGEGALNVARLQAVFNPQYDNLQVPG